jgi:putative membrane protein
MRSAAVPIALTALFAFTAPSLRPPVSPISSSRAVDDATIVAIFDAANTFDIEAGQLALKQSRDRRVTELAHHFITDHTALRDQGRELAAKLKVTPTPPQDFALAQEHAKAMAELKTKSGAEFDRAYAAHEVAFHEAVLQALKSTLIPEIENAELKTFVQKVAPAFEGHLASVRALAKKLEARS